MTDLREMIAAAINRVSSNTGSSHWEWNRHQADAVLAALDKAGLVVVERALIEGAVERADITYHSLKAALAGSEAIPKQETKTKCRHQYDTQSRQATVTVCALCGETHATFTYYGAPKPTPKQGEYGAGIDPPMPNTNYGVEIKPRMETE